MPAPSHCKGLYVNKSQTFLRGFPCIQSLLFLELCRRLGNLFRCPGPPYPYCNKRQMDLPRVTCSTIQGIGQSPYILYLRRRGGSAPEPVSGSRGPVGPASQLLRIGNPSFASMNIIYEEMIKDF